MALEVFVKKTSTIFYRKLPFFKKKIIKRSAMKEPQLFLLATNLNQQMPLCFGTAILLIKL